MEIGSVVIGLVVICLVIGFIFYKQKNKSGSGSFGGKSKQGNKKLF